MIQEPFHFFKLRLYFLSLSQSAIDFSFKFEFRFGIISKGLSFKLLLRDTIISQDIYWMQCFLKG